MSGKVVYRFYSDYEKEERWLNEMASRGWHLVRYRLGGYHFEQGEPGEWIYRIELLPADPQALRAGVPDAPAGQRSGSGQHAREMGLSA